MGSTVIQRRLFVLVTLYLLPMRGGGGRVDVEFEEVCFRGP